MKKTSWKLGQTTEIKYNIKLFVHPQSRAVEKTEALLKVGEQTGVGIIQIFWSRQEQDINGRWKVES